MPSAPGLWPLATARVETRWTVALWDCGGHVPLDALAHGSSLGGRLHALRDRSVLVATADQMTAALALIELDGVARRLVLWPPDLPHEHLWPVMATAEVDTVVSDRAAPVSIGDTTFVPCTRSLAPWHGERKINAPTEWVLLTSGTTGAPKLVAHTLSSLIAPITSDSLSAALAVWSTFYDIRRYGGLQIFLRALLGGSSMVFSSAHEPLRAFLTRAGARGVTHISGTPSHWRRALMSPAARAIAPRYVRLSGEIVDQALLDHLQATYPAATVSHAFASTEAGVAFAVGDGRAGFPARLVEEPQAAVALRVKDGSLRVRSSRTATGYLGAPAERLLDDDGFVDTGDLVERRGDRYHFIGRRGGVINVGGHKVHPEEVEAIINGHPKVRMSRVRPRQNPVTGGLVVADVVPRLPDGAGPAELATLTDEILQLCRGRLPRHKVPAAITFVPSLAVAGSGKIARGDA